ncbi:MAG TPA: glucans biosynthesis glucosyltransferase MdoH [Verrucomicrobiae bacterium]|nr:glucans biosynthesis glucosyltransferase MdoH [Verrucomicrobiae bacterium]
MSAPNISISRIRGRRLFIFYSLALLLTGVVSVLFADLLWRTGWSDSRMVLLILFVILFFLASVGCVHGVYGFILRRFSDRVRITRLKDYQDITISGASTAIVFPIFNENVERVCEGLRAIYESLQGTGSLEYFDFFILSDSTDANKWVEEERRWFELVRELDALGKVYYRRRLDNEGRKSGNIRDFLSSWGRRYRYFITCDADSVMRGETLLDLVKLMEAHPNVGLIQTVPALVNAESLFGRMQQFSNRLYGAVFITGLNYWTLDMGNYWGHNAIIRVEPFMQFCDLPRLPGHKPFGGQILSHDFVEAALLLRENRAVWLAYDLEGSYEESPQAMIENAQRDQRWCQGNLQHGLVMFFSGLRGVSRMHLFFGIMGYLASPLWLGFLITTTWILGYQKHTGLSVFTVHAILINLSGTAHALLIFVIVMTVLMLPKFLALVDLAFDPRRRRAFGGFCRATASVVCETIFSTLHAPLQMLWHTRFVFANLFGITVGWKTQKRAGSTTWEFALRRHWGHMLIGLLWGALMWELKPSLFWWFLPLFTGLAFSVPLSVFTSRVSAGDAARKCGLFLTPEETQAPDVLASLRTRLKIQELISQTETRRQHDGVSEAVLDPYLNAIHVSLLREKRSNPYYVEQFEMLGVGSPKIRSLVEKFLAEGPDTITSNERLLIMADANAMEWLHEQIWLRPGATLAPAWRSAIQEYRSE